MTRLQGRIFKTILMKKSISSVKLVSNSMDALDGADALILVTEWREFSNPDFSEIKSRMNGSLICDGRNLLSKSKALKEGFVYYGIGR